MVWCEGERALARFRNATAAPVGAGCRCNLQAPCGIQKTLCTAYCCCCLSTTAAWRGPKQEPSEHKARKSSRTQTRARRERGCTTQNAPPGNNPARRWRPVNQQPISLKRGRAPARRCRLRAAPRGANGMFVDRERHPAGTCARKRGAQWPPCRRAAATLRCRAAGDSFFAQQQDGQQRAAASVLLTGRAPG